jgi:hypothetical protein
MPNSWWGKSCTSTSKIVSHIGAHVIYKDRYKLIHRRLNLRWSLLEGSSRLYEAPYFAIIYPPYPAIIHVERRNA